jgi:hypothetical protein
VPISGMCEEAARVMRRNDMGGWTRAAPESFQHVGDPDERPTRLEYDRFIWLVVLSSVAPAARTP